MESTSYRRLKKHDRRADTGIGRREEVTLTSTHTDILKNLIIY